VVERLLWCLEAGVEVDEIPKVNEEESEEGGAPA